MRSKLTCKTMEYRQRAVTIKIMKNWKIILLFVVLIIATAYIYKFNNSSKNRFQKNTNITLPDNYDLIKDEYHDMLQDYCIVFKIKLKNEDLTTIVKSLKGQKHWTATDVGYKFINEIFRSNYSAIIDTIENTIDYKECHD